MFPDVDKTALAVARKLGIRCDRAVVLAEGMNAVVHLRPSPLVARVTRVAHLVRPVEALAGVVAMARALRGLVVPPSDQVDPGPHVEGGRYVTFWAHVEGVPATPAEAGSSLRALHQAARRYDLRLRSFDPRPEALRITNLVGGEVGCGTACSGGAYEPSRVDRAACARRCPSRQRARGWPVARPGRGMHGTARVGPRLPPALLLPLRRARARDARGAGGVRILRRGSCCCAGPACRSLHRGVGFLGAAHWRAHRIPYPYDVWPGSESAMFFDIHIGKSVACGLRSTD